MACIWTDDPEYPFYEQCHAAYETLSNAVDAKGRKLKVYKLCMPVNPLFMDQASCDTIDADENAEPRVPDEPLIASYMNYLVTNHASSSRSTATRTTSWPSTRSRRSTTKSGARASTSAWRPVRAGRLRRRQHPLHHAAGAVRVIVCLPEAPHLAAQPSLAYQSTFRSSFAATWGTSKTQPINRTDVACYRISHWCQPWQRCRSKNVSENPPERARCLETRQY